MARYRERLKGGRATGRRPSDFDPEQLATGTEVEMEHTGHWEVAREIAMDHLAEYPDYYRELAKMERKLERKKKATRNALWVERIMRRRWQALKREVGPDLLPARRDGRMIDYGCGLYGCVLPVSPGIVLKITTDASEAAFVAAAMTMPWPPGIVQYGAALAIPDRYNNRPVFLLWREEAYEVGALTGYTDPKRNRRYHEYEAEFGRSAITSFYTRLRDFRNDAEEIYELLVDEKDQARFLDEVGFNQQLIAEGERWMPGPQDWAAMAAHYAHNCAIYATQLSSLPFGSSIGEALGYYLERGMVLADVHLGNIGEVRDDPADTEDWDLAIIDPGVMVPLHRQWLDVPIPRLGR